MVAIVGPTGVGKSALAMALASRFQSEIICADSRQVYRYLDIGTEKPSAEDRARVPHHLLDLVLPDQRYSVVDFVRDASHVVANIPADKVAIIAGGSGYYVRSLLQGRSYAVPDSESNLSAIEAQLAADGAEAALAEIAAVDPHTATRLDTANLRRVARALDIIRQTGLPVPALTHNPMPALVIGLNRSRPVLYARLDERVEKQIAAGLVEETRQVLNLGFSSDLPVLRGLAYGQMMKFLEGEWTLADASQAYKYATHGLVRRQLTWFRKEPGIIWLDVDDSRLVDRATRLVEDHLELLKQVLPAKGGL